MVARNKKAEPRHGHLFLKTPLADFTLRLRFKAVSGNSGLYFRTEQRPGNIGIAGLQAEIDATKDVGGLYETAGRRWLMKPTAKAVQGYFRPGQWNEMTVSAHGRRVVVHVNGKRTAELRDDPGRLTGQVALQLHGGQDVEIHFKDIALLTPVTP